MANFLKKLFGSKAERDVKAITPILNKILEEYDRIDKLSHDEIRAESAALRARIAAYVAAEEGEVAEIREKLTDVEIAVSEKERLATRLADLAAIRDFLDIDCDTAVWKNEWLAGGNLLKWDMVHYDVQLIGGVVLHQGKIAEMATGEGKTLVATLPVFLNALAGKGVHVVTVNDYLSKRDSEWMGPLYQFHGLSVD